MKNFRDWAGFENMPSDSQANALTTRPKEPDFGDF